MCVYYTDYWFRPLQPRFLVMLFTGGGSSSADEMYGHAERPYHQPDDPPVIKEVCICMIYEGKLILLLEVGLVLVA